MGLGACSVQEPLGIHAVGVAVGVGVTDGAAQTSWINCSLSMFPPSAWNACPTVAPTSWSFAANISGRDVQVLVAGSQAIALLLMAKLTSPPVSSHLPLYAPEAAAERPPGRSAMAASSQVSVLGS